MTPTQLPQNNFTFTTPEDLEKSQCGDIPCFRGTIQRGSLEGAPIIVTAWMPHPEELEALNRGEPVYVTTLGNGLPAQMLTTSFEAATSPA